MNRRTVIIAIILLLIIFGIGVALYFGAISPQSPRARQFFGNLPIIGGRAPLGGESPTPTPTPPSDQSRVSDYLLRQIVDKEVMAPAESNERNSLLYLLRDSGHIVSSGFDGREERTVSNLTVLEVFDASWASKKNSVAMFYHEGGVVKKFLNGVATGTRRTFLPQETAAFDWSPDGLSIAYLLKRAEDTALVIADSQNRNPRVVYSTPIPDFTVSWAAKNTILLVSRPSGLAPSLILRFDLVSRSTSILLSGRRGVVVKPLPDASGFLFSQSSASGQAELLARYTFGDRQVTPLAVVTLAEKCAAAPRSKMVYCGVPRQPLGATLPDQWYAGTLSFSDRIVAIDPKDGSVTTLMEGVADVDVVSPFVSTDEQHLFFLDKKTSTLWRLDLATTTPGQ
ncbi:MAG: hypothetical protein HY473_00325 [Candidatus Sungbacteria bacterium]|uniref:Dipeptidylpeptidase IV N-terminal domain-containing protein n=1 Tax=Candidatus Sungiibacteriota bacterium TaxID=2750080 RepID=A0A932YW34_9BACT|nr:hypothetical protein [Candidatus Sungbacteria bacterium]